MNTKLLLGIVTWSVVLGSACAGVASEPGDVTREVEKIAAMSPAELRAYERRLIHELANLELVPPWVITNPPSRYAKAKQNFAMNGGITETPKGRLWAVWFGGEDGPRAFMLASFSDDRGATWSETAFVVDTHLPGNCIDWQPIQRSILIGNVWTDPKGRLHLFVNQSLGQFDGRASTWEFVCDDPDAPVPVWGKPRYIWHGGMHNKVTVLKDGTWLLPVELESDRGRVFPELDPLRGLGFFASTDDGRTWTKRGFTRPDHGHFAEQMAVERKDGTLWMLMRTGLGLMECFSSDKGQTWTKPALCANLKQPVSRFSLIRLKSGNLLFVKNGRRADAFRYDSKPLYGADVTGEMVARLRSELTAFISEDDGKTWRGGLVLDGRDSVAYPDAMQAKDGTIFVTYDHNRYHHAELLCARFTEADVMAEKIVDASSALRLKVCAYEEYETDAMKPFPVLKPVPERLADVRRGFQSAPSLTVAPKGRLWVAWHTGDTTEGDENGMVVVSSGDGGDTWTPPLFAIDPPGPLRILDPGLWTDPDGKVWLFYAQLYGMWDGRAGVWAMQPVDPEDANTAWTPARRLCHGFMKNKPIVTRDGTWLLPSEFMNGKPWGGRLGASKPIPPEFVFDMPEYHAANVFASKDKGRTVSFLGRAQIPPKDRDCTENMVVERKDGSLWMLVRTKYGIGETVSTDGGKTWTEVKPSAIQNPNSRFYIGRLKSGAMLLVKNGPTDKRIGRSRITAFVSDDDGATWLGGLVLDERNHVSYPDAAEGPDGFIHVVHDRERTKAREILHHRFTEADVRAGRLVTPGSRLKIIVNKAGPKAK